MVKNVVIVCMMVSSLFFKKQNKQNIGFQKKELLKNSLKAIVLDQKLQMEMRLLGWSFLCRQAKFSENKIRLCCLSTKRAGSVNKHVGFSRIVFRLLALHGNLSGIVKKSW